MQTTFNIDALTAAHKTAASDAQALAASSFEGFEKLVALNMSVARTALTQTSPDLLSAFSAKSPSDALAAQASMVKPLAEQAVAYGRSVYTIAADVNAQLTKVAEAQAATGQKQIDATLDAMLQNAPAGSEPMVTAFKTAVTTGQNAIQTAKSSAKKAAEMADQQARQLIDNTMGMVKTTSRRK